MSANPLSTTPEGADQNRTGAIVCTPESKNNVHIGAFSRPGVAYATVHQRLWRQRGHASHHACVDCGGEARDWSYTGKKGEWSEDLSTYEPRCGLCHHNYDNPADIRTYHAQDNSKLRDAA